MRYGLTVPHFGPFADARVLAGLASGAEAAGWDGFFIWDHVAMAWPDDVVDTTVALTAIALATERVRFGALVTPLPRRRVTKVARETATLDRLSGGRLVFGAGLGIYREEFDALGDEPEMRRRASMLDEGLDVLSRLWAGGAVSHAGEHYAVETTGFTPVPVQQPRIPVWVAASWPGRKPFERAARWDGVCAIRRGFELGKALTPDDVREIVALCRSQRAAEGPFEVVVSGVTAAGGDRGLAKVTTYAEAGATWWLEDLSPWPYGWEWTGAWPLEAMRERLAAGPPGA